MILVEFSNKLFETSTNSVLCSKFIVKTSHETVKTSHETVKSCLFYMKSGINACEVPHNLHWYIDEISKSDWALNGHITMMHIDMILKALSACEMIFAHGNRSRTFATHKTKYSTFIHIHCSVWEVLE
jgi:hypothetical protein